MRDCVKCGKPVDGAVCPSCGYREQYVAPIAHSSFQPLPRRTPESDAARDRTLAALRDFRFAKPSKDWAIKLLRRESTGHHYPPVYGQFALEALGEAIEREPGQDD